MEARRWAQLAVICGFVAGASFFLLSAIDLPLRVGVVLVCAFGPTLAVFSAGLYAVLRLHRPTVSLVMGLGTNIAAAIAVTMMLLAQVGYREVLELEFGGSASAGVASPAYQAANGIQLGLDMAWDLFLALGAFLLALNMWSHPRFGRLFSGVGILLAVGLLTLNIATFPKPPAESHFVDLGPLVGVWYLAVTVSIARSLTWVRHRG